MVSNSQSGNINFQLFWNGPYERENADLSSIEVKIPFATREIVAKINRDLPPSCQQQLMFELQLKTNDQTGRNESLCHTKTIIFSAGDVKDIALTVKGLHHHIRRSFITKNSDGSVTEKECAAPKNFNVLIPSCEVSGGKSYRIMVTNGSQLEASFEKLESTLLSYADALHSIESHILASTVRMGTFVAFDEEKFESQVLNSLTWWSELCSIEELEQFSQEIDRQPPPSTVAEKFLEELAPKIVPFKEFMLTLKSVDQSKEEGNFLDALAKIDTLAPPYDGQKNPQRVKLCNICIKEGALGAAETVIASLTDKEVADERADLQAKLDEARKSTTQVAQNFSKEEEPLEFSCYQA